MNSTDSSTKGDSVPPLIQASGNDKDKDKGQECVHSSRYMPIQQYRLTKRMKSILWELVVLSNETVRMENERK